jgi:GxxExxY protein
MEAKDYPYSDITEKIIGCAMKVHSYFGLGFPEIIYKRGLMLEFDKVGLRYNNEVEKDIWYHNQLIGKRRLDLIVEEKVLIELKAVAEVDDKTFNQITNYLNVFDIEVGLLLNFGMKSLQFKRFANTRKNQRNHNINR